MSLDSVSLVEVGPRDGLQNETRVIPTDTKIAFVDALSRTGVDEIEVSSFVAPRKIPQLADAEEVFRGIHREPGVVYSALVPNVRGLDRALSVEIDRAVVFTAASETFNRQNIDATLQDSLKRFRGVVGKAAEAGVPVRGSVSTAFWCPYEGRVPPQAAHHVVEELLDLGVDHVTVSDTIGWASPKDIEELFELLLKDLNPTCLSLHVHDTRGQGASNVRAAYSLGIRRFDASTGGIGGCPFAPGAAGNIDMSTLVRTLTGLGAAIRVNGAALERARAIVLPFLK
ncbi:MAG: hydroxymethylglutaryl-CoA lyase [Spirochaetaceae bacterium]